MNKTDKFITIGELSNLTGVNAKSLRYYEKIGVLFPAWVDPKNSYRYYTFSQIILVYSIQHYVEAGVPLETLRNYMDSATNKIHFQEQVAYGIEEAKQKIEKLEQFLHKSEMLQQEMFRCERIKESDVPISNLLPEKHCFIVPSESNLSYQKYSVLLKKLLMNMQKDGIKTGSEMGMMYLKSEGNYQAYVFVDICPDDLTTRNDHRYFHIPEQSYLSMCLDFPEYDIFKKHFQSKKPALILLSELLSADFDFRNPDYEMRWA